MGPQEDYIETVFTCEGDYNDPHLQDRLEDFQRGLKDLLLTDKRKLILKKVEPWNSVRVTFNIPREAALRLKHLAQQGNTTLRSLGVLAVQIQGDQLISLTIAGRNNERTELVFRTTDKPSHTPAISVFDASLHVTDEMSSPDPSNVETTRKNIAEYLRQGTLFDSLFTQDSSNSMVFRSPNVVATSCDPIPFLANNVIQSSAGLPQHMSKFQGQTTGFPIGRSLPGYTTSPSQTITSSTASKSPVSQPKSPKYPSQSQNPSGISTGFPSGIIPSQSLQKNDMLFQPSFQQSSNIINNLQKTFKTATSTSPLLVNLLQTDPNAAVNSIHGSKMPPPLPEDSPPPPKRKRKPRKPKESKIPKPLPPGSEEEISIESIPNPVRSTHVIPLVTSGNGSSVSNTHVVAHSLPVAQTSVTYATQDRQSSFTTTDSSHLSNNNSSQHVQERLTEGVKNPNVDITSLDTTGKIVNPYTGLLEPIESLSDSSPSKGDSCKEQSPFSSPLKMPNRTEGIKKLETVPESGSVYNRTFLTSLNSSDETLLASRASHVYSTASGNQTSNSRVSLSQNLSHPALVSTSSHVFVSQANIPMHSSHFASSPLSLDLFVSNHHGAMQTSYSSPSVQNTIRKQECLAQNIKSDIMRQSSICPFTCHPGTAFESSEHLVAVASSDTECRTSVSGEHVHPISRIGTNQKVPQTTEPNSDSLQRKSVQQDFPDKGVFNHTHVFISKSDNTDSQVAGSPNCRVASDGDSENSSQGSVLHDVQLPSDMGSLPNGPSLDPGLKPYNHDSGVGSSSERSDDTPSEPGDGDFKAGHALPEDCVKSHLSCDNLSKKTPKTDTNVITVGYALSKTDTVHHPTELISAFNPGKGQLDMKLNSENCRKHSNTMIETNNLVSNLASWSAKKKVDNMHANVLSKTVAELAQATMSTAVLKKNSGISHTNLDLIRDKLIHNENTSMEMDTFKSKPGIYQDGSKKKTVDIIQTQLVVPNDNNIVLPPVTASMKRCTGKSSDLLFSTSPAPNCSRANPCSDASLNGSKGMDPASRAVGSRIQENHNPSMLQSMPTLTQYPVMHDLSMHNVNQLDDSALMSTKCLDLTAASKNSLSDSVVTNLLNIEEKLPIGEKARNPHTGHSSNLRLEINFARLTNHLSGVSSTYETHPQHTQFPHKPSSASNDMSVVSSSNLTAPISLQNSIANVTSIYSSTVPSVSCLQNISPGGNNTVINSPNMESGKIGVVGKSGSHSLDPPKSNITSMYTRRSSPVNSSLNSMHCFDPALPLPKRLTESIQKLVKPLMTLDSATSSQRKSPISCIPKTGTPTSSPSKGSARLGNCSASRYSGTCVGGSVPSYDLPVSSPLLGSGCKMVGIDSSNCEDILPGIRLSPLSSLSGEICVNEPACSSSVVPLSSQSTITAHITSAAPHAAHVSNIYSFATNSLQSSYYDKTIVSTSSVSQPSQSVSVQRIVSESEHHSMVSNSSQTFSEKMCSPKESNVFETSSELATDANCVSISKARSSSYNEVQEQVQSETTLCNLSTQESSVLSSVSQCITPLMAPSVSVESPHYLSEAVTDTCEMENGTAEDMLQLVSTCSTTDNTCDSVQQGAVIDKSSSLENLSGNFADRELEVEQCSQVRYESDIDKNECNTDDKVIMETASITNVIVDYLVDRTNTDETNNSNTVPNLIANSFSCKTVESELESRSKTGHVDAESTPLVNSMDSEKITSLSINVEESHHHSEIIDLDIKSQRARRTSESSDGSLQSSGNTRAFRACRKRVTSAEQNTDDDPEGEKSQRPFRRRKTLNDSENSIDIPEEKMKVHSENLNDSSIINLKNKLITSFDKCVKEESNLSRVCDISGRTESQTLIDTVKSGLRVRATVRNALNDDTSKTNTSTKDALVKDLKRESRTPLNKFILEKSVKTAEEDAASRRTQMNRRGRQTDKTVACNTREKSPFRGTRRGRNSPNVEQQEDIQKRATRSSKQKISSGGSDTSEIPPAKRRRSSRDHK
ncbi:hypothetical protein ScPMuIL_001625 [Solemya velum]